MLNVSIHSHTGTLPPSFPRAFISLRYESLTITCPSQVICTTLLHHSHPIRVCGVSLEPHNQWQVFDRSSLELLLDMLKWKFCFYLSLSEFDLVAFVRLFRFFLIRIVILNAFLIHLLPLHEMKISQSDLWVQTLHIWLYSQGVVHPCFLVSYRCVLIIEKSNASCTVLNVSIYLRKGTPSLFPKYSGPQNQYTMMKINKWSLNGFITANKNKQENFWEDSTKNDLLQAEARELRV